MGGNRHCDPPPQVASVTAAMALAGRQGEIVQATLDLAFDVGPDAVSTSLIAKRLGLSQPAIYKHFKTKDAIWLAACGLLSDRITDNIQTCRASLQPPMQRLRDLILRHLTFIQEVPALPDIMVMRHASASHQVIRQRLQAEMARLHQEIVTRIQHMQDQGGIRTDLAATDAATLVMGVMQGLVLRMIVSRDPSRLVVEGARLFDLQIAGLAPRKTTP